MSLQTMSGLEILRAMLAGKLPPPSIATTMPFVFTSIDEGSVAGTAKADDRHLNPMGGVHGGFAATVLDSATGCAVHTMLGPGQSYGTVDLHVQMVRPLPKDEEVHVEARVLNISRNLAISEGSIKNKEGKLLAHATATCFLIAPRG